MAQPSFPNEPNLSCRKYDPRTALYPISDVEKTQQATNKSSPDQDTERAQRRNENGGREGIRSEIRDFPDSHCRLRQLLSWVCIGQVSIHVMTPAHHMGLFKY